MKGCKPIAAAWMSLLLLISVFPAFAVQQAEAAELGSGALDIPSGKVMIKNKWKSNYLYEASDGTVRYGMTNPADESAQWTVDTDNGLSRIRNVKTGHYITVAGTQQRYQALTTSGTADSNAEKWIIDRSNRAGYMIVRSATVPEGNLVIHEEDQLGFAEASSDINITFESPQWAFIAVEGSPVRIESFMRPGSVIYEEDGLVKHGVRPADDLTSHWYIESGGQDQVRIRNRATGHVITQNETTWAGIFAKDEDPAQPGLSRWKQENAVSQSGYVVFENVTLPENWINPQFPDDNDVRSNNWAGGPEGVNALWRIVPASDLPAVRIAAYTDAKVAADFLFEDEGGVYYGAIDPASSSDPRYLWIVEDYDLSKRIRNTASNHYLNIDGDRLSTGNASVTGATYEWSLTASDSYDDYNTIRNVGRPGLYISTGPGGSATVTTDADSLGSQWELVDPAAVLDGSDQYIRIQNVWQPFYLYENADGTIKYGNMRTDDRRDQWLVVKHNGRKLLQNRETGHYMNIAEMPDGHIQATPLQDLTNVDEAYIWSGKNIGGGTYLLSNVTDKTPGEPFAKFISIQNLTKYAEYGVINPNWGSPQWKFLPVAEKKNQHYRFKLQGTNDQYLQDVRTADPVTEVTYGAADDEYSIWFLDEKNGANGPVMMKNMGSGRYLSIQNLAEEQVESEDEPQLTVEARSEVYDVWGSVKWNIEQSESDEVNIQSAWTGHVLYAALNEQGQPALKVSRAEGAADRAESKFVAEPAQIAEKPIPEGPVRIKSVTNQSYLYENRSGVVLYGDLAEDNGYSHWTIQRGADGRQRIQNRATGHYITLTEDYSFLESKETDPAADGASSWSVTRVAGGDQVLIRSQYGDYDDEFIHVQNNTGYAERGLYPESWGSVQWELEPAPQQFNTPDMDEERNLNTATPIQNDTNIVMISPQGAGGVVLAEQGGTVKLVHSDDAKGASNWMIQDYNGRHLIKNTATGRYLTLDGKGKAAVSTSMKALETQWVLDEKLGYRTLSNTTDPNGLLQYSPTGVMYGTASLAEPALWSFTPVASDIAYAAEDAFKTDKVIRFAVHAQEQGEYAGLIRYKNNSGSEQQLSVTVNGLGEQSVLLTRSDGVSAAEVKLSLRAGMNTVSLSGIGADISALQIDSLIVKHSVNKAYRGATVPYISYEAEDAKTNGTLLGPSRKYRSIASEASGRQAVRLGQTGDYVEFNLAQPANALVLRYSIPDSKDGQGEEHTLSLYVNGEFRQSLTLTSKYAWEYGSYPWSNDPRQGSGHRFFDEIHALIGDVPQGAAIRLQKDGGDRADYYVIDLVEMEKAAPAYEKPEGFLSVTDFGAIPNDGQDDTAALKNALAAAKAQGAGVWFPEGSFDFGDELLHLDSAVIRGAGMWHTTLNGAKFYGHGGTVEVYDLLIDGGINERDDEAFTNAFHGAFGPGSIIQHVWIEHTKAGLWLTQPIGEKARTNGLYMMGLRIRNLMADGINFAVGTSNSMMEQSDIRYPGDDGIAMWSFTDGKLVDVNGSERTPSVNNTARFNTVTLPWLADNIVVFGGKDNKIQDNVVKDTVTNGAGIAVSTRFNAEPFAGTTVVERNTLVRTGSYDTGYAIGLGALWLFAGESDMKGKIIVQDNVAKDSTYAGLIAHGDFAMHDVLLKNIVIDGTGTNGVDVTSGLKGSATVDNVIIRGDRMKMVSNPSAAFSFKEINEGFASGKKPPVDPGDPGEPGSGGPGGGNTGGSGSSGGGSSGVPATKPADSMSDSALQEALRQGKTLIELRTDAAGSVNLTGSVLTAAAAEYPETVIEITGEDGSVYRFPLKLTDQIMKQAGVVDREQAVVSIRIVPLSRQEQSGLAEQAKKQGLELIGAAKKFAVQVTEGDKTVEIARYEGATYVERQWKVDGKLDPATTAVLLYDPESGKLSYVPARLEANPDGTTTVIVKSAANGIFVVARHAVTFADLEGHWAKAEIEKLGARQILNGVGEDRFAPGRSVSRAEFAAMLVRALDLQGGSGAASFRDVKPDAWYGEAVATAVRYGLVLGYADHTFRPNAAISREEMAVMAARALRLLHDGAMPSNGAKASSSAKDSIALMTAFTDGAQIHPWALKEVELLLQTGIMQGQSKDKFAPANHTTRAEAAVIVSRLLVSMKLLNP
ncbi:hypothetical protein PAE9249_03980 [Paenibacillus sp. CECT 9249]|uniref:S-layer homology domain-containing protein n=1 Tax=Paenibacillus sp. CECT 9249 TaxID=2845385 RepID=UPI001E47B9B7|nr:S-layer homology domain-containing protein [Paenibacillus sp. CECT 9249]CAH0121451.1 hypothetical protein PAE9249_03980 [Paenibacillus sp. CECT 9249]